MARRIRCVTFDCYGTLIDWQQGIELALLAIPAFSGDRKLVRRIVARREEIEKPMLVSAPDLPDEESPEETWETLEYRPYREILAESIRFAAREEGVEIGEADAARAAATMPAWEPYPDTARALERIRARYPIGILSNVEEEVIAATIRRIGVPFDLVVTAERVESYKPAPDHWFAAMHELGADEDEIFHVAVSPFHDLESATLLGIPCGYVNRSGYPLGKEASPLFTVPDLAQAAARLESFAAGAGKRAGGRDREAVRPLGSSKREAPGSGPGRAGRGPRRSSGGRS